MQGENENAGAVGSIDTADKGLVGTMLPVADPSDPFQR